MSAPSDRDDEPNPQERVWLEGARRAFTPTPADAARVRAAVTLALAPTSAPPSPSPTGGDGSPPPPLFSKWFAKLAIAGTLSAVTGAGGYHLGFQAGRDSVTTATATAAAKSPALPAPAAPSAASTAPGAREVEPLPAIDPPPSAPARAAQGSALELRGSASSERAASSLEDETRLLARIERALRDHNPRFALGLLGELDRSVPGGQLTEERAAARAIAHCQLGSEAAPGLAREFARRYAKSAYRTRIDETCALERATESTPQ